MSTARQAKPSVPNKTVLPAYRPGVDPQRIRVAALLAPARARTAWVKELEHPKASHRAAAAIALGAVEQRDGAHHLGRLLLKDRSATVRSLAAEALGMMGGHVAVAALLAASSEQDGGVRHRVVEALGRMAPPEELVLARLDQGAGSSHAAEAEASLMALFHLDPSRAHHHARTLCGHVHPAVRRAALLVASTDAGSSHLVRGALDDEDEHAARLAQTLALSAGLA